MPDTFSYLRYHLVWTTKNRESHLDPVWRDQLYRYLSTVMSRKRGRLVAVGGIVNHIHLLVSLPIDMPPSYAVNVLKSNSSRWIRQTFPIGVAFGWQIGYGVFTVSRSLEASAIRYIHNQEAHHARGTFEEEMEALCRKHDIVWHDERRVHG